MTHTNGNHKTSPFVTVARDVSQVAHDVVELAELQTALARIELTGWWKQFITPVVFVTCGSVLGIGCLPVLLGGAALQLSTMTELTLPLSLLIVGGTALLLALLMGLAAYVKVKNARGPLQQSRQEFSRNLMWIKSALKGNGSPQPR